MITYTEMGMRQGYIQNRNLIYVVTINIILDSEKRVTVSVNIETIQQLLHGTDNANGRRGTMLLNVQIGYVNFVMLKYKNGYV